MRLCSYSAGDRGGVGVVIDHRIADAAELADAVGLSTPTPGRLSLGGLIAADDDVQRSFLNGLAEGARALDAVGVRTVEASAVTLHSPFRPRQGVIVASGNSTRLDGRTKSQLSPIQYFSKMSSAVLDPGGEIRWPPTIASEVYAEPQLAIIVGRELSVADPSRAALGVFGYAVATNVMAKDLRARHSQLMKAGSLDSFLPWGPILVTADEVVDVDALDGRLKLNGRVVLEGSTGDARLSVGETLSQLSHGITLRPGDVVLLGSFESEGYGPIEAPRFLHEGDQVKSEIDGVGSIANTVGRYWSSPGLKDT